MRDRAARAMAVATVIGIDGTLKGERFTAGDEPITFGRGEENDVVLPSTKSSRVHAELRHEADRGWVLLDRDSRNGTWVTANA